ncbi:MAG TPA: Fur family transcriptional regulator [Ignavibacteria bacterium]|nr:Fur family transcriptional regulator [Ignavibacteria bacterium]HRK00647.1 Fur family transcriptional regulator [Ignavibacteria bacterium]
MQAAKSNNGKFKAGDTAEFRSILNSHSLKVTKPRIEIMKILKSNHKPLTISEISGKLTNKKTDLVTVYRTMNLFEELGIVNQIDFKDEYKRYELIYDRHHHHHIVCRKCRKVENVETCLPEGFEKLLLKTGYSEITHSLEFFGICGSCKTA